MHGQLRNVSLLVGPPDGATPDEARRLAEAGDVDLIVLSRDLADDARESLRAVLLEARPQLTVLTGGPDTLAATQGGQAQAHDLAARLAGASDLDFLELAPFNQGSVGVFRCGPGTSPWEHHPDDAELLYVLEGAVELTVLTDQGAITTLVEPGSAFVVPKGLWHKHHVPERLVEFYATPGGTIHSDADDPRLG